MITSKVGEPKTIENWLADRSRGVAHDRIEDRISQAYTRGLDDGLKVTTSPVLKLTVIIIIGWVMILAFYLVEAHRANDLLEKSEQCFELAVRHEWNYYERIAP